MIEVIGIRGVATIQDAGRPGRMHEGVPRGGPLVPEAFARANAFANDPSGLPLGKPRHGNAAAIELFGTIEIAARDEAVIIGTSSGRVELARDATHSIQSRGRVEYVALRGGIDVPMVLGGRGTLLVAKLGGLGRPLIVGDRLVCGRLGSEDRASIGLGESVHADVPLPSPYPLPRAGEETRIRVVAGPDPERFASGAMETLVGSTFEISRHWDRTGTRLVGPSLARTDGDRGASMPMVAGAIQVTQSGEAIVLGPDAPTTGGYPIIAVVAQIDFGRFHAHRVGDRIAFQLIGPADARRAWLDHKRSFVPSGTRTRA